MNEILHRGGGTAQYCTPQQGQQYCLSLGARFVQRKGAVDWWKLGDGSWLAMKWHSATQCELKRLPASACGCGG